MKNNEEKWINFFKCLDDYYLENGNLNFPVSYKVNDLRIGDRLYTIRKLYNEKKEKLHPKLIKKLEAYVGWSWEHHSKTIFKYDDDKVINELKNYYNKNKNFEIHRDTILNDIKLGQLIYRYKRNYKFGKLKPELIMKLEALEGWHW